MFLTLAVPYFLIYIHRTTGGAISDILQDYYGVGTTSVALLASSYLYGYMAMQIPAGLLTDKVGPRKCICFFLVMVSLGTLLCAYSAAVSDFNLMLLGKTLIGLCAAFITIPTLKGIASWFSRDRFTTADGVFMFIGNIGSIVAAAPMVLMLENAGITRTYLLLATMFFLVSVVCWLVIHDRVDTVDVEVKEPRKYGSIEALKIILTSGRRFWALALMELFLSSTMVWSASQAGAYYGSVYGFSLTDAGLMVSMFAIGYAISCALSGVLADYVLRSRKKVLIICSISSVFFWALIFVMTSFRLFDSVLIQGAINVGFGVASGMTIATFAQVRCLFPLEIAGTSLSLLNFFPFLGGATLILISGMMIPNKSPEEYALFWGIMLVFAIIAMVLSFISIEEKYPDPE